MPIENSPILHPLLHLPSHILCTPHSILHSYQKTSKKKEKEKKKKGNQSINQHRFVSFPLIQPQLQADAQVKSQIQIAHVSIINFHPHTKYHIPNVPLPSSKPGPIVGTVQHPPFFFIPQSDNGFLPTRPLLLLLLTSLTHSTPHFQSRIL